MRKLSIFIAVIVFTACNSSKEKSMGGTANPDSTGTTNTNAAPLDTKGYNVLYSSSFNMGPTRNAETVLELWKNWDANTLEAAKDFFADSVSLFFNDGGSLLGKRDTVIATAKTVRGSMGELSSQVHAIVSLHSTDKDQDWVAIWGVEYRNNKKDSTQLFETWRFTKDGKIDLLYQYKADNPKEMK